MSINVEGKPVVSITAQGISINVPQPYAEGDTLRVNEASVLLQRSNNQLGVDYETVENVREVSPEF